MKRPYPEVRKFLFIFFISPVKFDADDIWKWILRKMKKINYKKIIIVSAKILKI